MTLTMMPMYSWVDNQRGTKSNGVARNVLTNDWPRWRQRYLPFSPVINPTLTNREGYGPLIRAYVQFLLAKLRFHRLRPEFNGLFEYEEYVTLKGIDDPNEG